MLSKKQKLISIFFINGVMSFYWCGCSQESERKDTPTKVVTYDFLDNLGSAEIITQNARQVKKSRLRLNNWPREVLFEYPNSKVIFKDVSINKNGVLKFGIGIAEWVWDKPGDGVMFRITIVDENLQNTLLFSQYIDPKNSVWDRKWVDARIDLSTFAGQKVSFIFKTTGVPQNNISHDWAGWSNPQLTSMKCLEKEPI